MISCRQATQLLSDAQEYQLPLKVKVKLKIHVTMCSACHNFEKQMRILRVTARTYAKGAISNKDHGENSNR